jgi:SAM-dependent methyltransferase
MRPREAETLARWVLELDLPRGAVCLNIGSSTKRFREIEQPHIEEKFIEPLKASGLRFIHCDMKEAEGVDEIGDILDPAFRTHLRKHEADLLVCSNLLEHLTNPQEFARACGELVRGGGFALFSVPSSYPYHADPIDTMLRPSPSELTAMLPGWNVVKAVEMKVGDYWQDLRMSGKPAVTLLKFLARVMMPFYRPQHWRSIAGRLPWLFRPYQVSIALLEKPQ